MRQKEIRIVSWILTVIIMIGIVLSGGMGEVNAQENYDGYVYVTVERSTVGQGQVVLPIKVGYQNGDTAALILEKVLGEKSPYYGKEIDHTYYLSSVMDGGEPGNWSKSDIPSGVLEALGGEGSVGTRNKADILETFDYGTQSGWSFTIDDTFPNVGAGEYQLDTDSNQAVLRLQFSVYGWGADLAGYTWGTPLITFADKKTLIKAMANYMESKNTVCYKKALTVLSDWDAGQEEIDAVAAGLEEDNQISIEYEDKHREVMDYIKNTVTEPGCYSIGGEWAVLSRARSGITDVKWYRFYYNQVVDKLKENSNRLHNSKSTENSRAVIALTAIGANPTDTAGYNLVEPLMDLDYVGGQGLNGYIYALIALNCREFNISNQEEICTQLIEQILNREIQTGGWSLSGDVMDADITAMTIQALAPYYLVNDSVKDAVDTALTALSDAQKGDGGFANTYIDENGATSETQSSESCSQVLCALSTLRIDAEADSRFVKNGNSVLDKLLSYVDNSGGFRHISEGAVNQMATEQAAYALTAYLRLKNNQNSLYDMSDAVCLYQCAKDAHKWNEGEVITPATETVEGEKMFTCTICGETKTESIPKMATQPPITEQPVTERPTTEQPTTQPPTTEKVSVQAPKKTKISKVKSPKKKRMKVTWKKKKGVTGYQIQISTSSKFKKAKTYKVSGQNVTSKTIKSLKSKKKYYVRIRTYLTKKVARKRVTKYSGWSAKKTVRVK